MTSSQALIFYAAIMVAAYLAVIDYPNLPFLAFATQMTIAFVAFITKRLIGRKAEYFKDKQ